MTNQVAILSCMECQHHEVIPDPDPYDSFCYDDKAVACKITPTPPDKLDMNSKYLSDRHPNRCSAKSCRPYNVFKEATIPDWCPRLKKG